MIKPCTRDWLLQSITAVILIPLFVYSVFTFLTVLSTGGAYADMIAWVKLPCVSVTLLLLICIGFYHGAIGMEVVIDDYITPEFLRINSIRLINLSALAMALVGILSIIEILFEAPV